MRVALPVVVAIAAMAVALLVGCGAQDEVIGQGPQSLVFENDGSREIAVEVRWTNNAGRLQSRGFDLEVNGRVELRIANRPEYKVLLEAESDSLAADDPAPTPEPAPAPSGDVE